jgi:hypothetical protein
MYRKLIAFVVITAFLFPLISPSSFAATSLSIKGGDKVSGGENFTVTVTYSGGSVGRVNAGMSYDTNKLTYISGGTSTGNSGYIQLENAGTGENISFKIKFQALKEGSTTVKVTTYEMYDLNEQALGTPSSSKTITIAGDAQDDQVVTQETDESPDGATIDSGVDEIEQVADDPAVSTNKVLIISSCVVLALICIIIALLISKRRGARKGKRR